MNTTSKTSEEIQNSFNEILSITSEQERIELEAQSLAFSFLAEIDKVMSEQQMSKKRLAANLFRATQTEDKLRRDKIKSKQNTNKTHFEVGQKVRQTIMELGGTMPEDFL